MSGHVWGHRPPSRSSRRRHWKKLTAKAWQKAAYARQECKNVAKRKKVSWWRCQDVTCTLTEHNFKELSVMQRMFTQNAQTENNFKKRQRVCLGEVGECSYGEAPLRGSFHKGRLHPEETVWRSWIRAIKTRKRVRKLPAVRKFHPQPL